MTAPTTSAPTQTVPIANSRSSVPTTNCDFWTVPTTAAAGALTGLMLRSWLTTEGRFVLVVVILGVLLVVTAVWFVGLRLLDRGGVR